MSDGGPRLSLNLCSIWAVIQHGAALDTNKTALVAPNQPSSHLSGLIKPFPSTAVSPRWCGLGIRQQAKKWTSPSYILGSLISWFLPTPTKLDCLTWSFAELERAAVRMASVLTANGIQPGATILLIVPSSAEWALMLWVCAFRCYTAVTADKYILEPGNVQALREHVDQLSPAAVVVSTTSEAAIVDRFTAQKKPFMGLTIEKSEKSALKNWKSFPEIAELQLSESLDTKPTPDSLDRVAMIIYTSGTSNHKPKACLRRVSELLGPFTVGGVIPPLSPPVTLVNTKSYQATAPCLLFATWYSGNAAALAGGLFDPATTLATAATCRPLTMSLMLQMADLIRNRPDYTVEKVKSLRYVQLIGSTITMESLRRAKKTFPNATVSGGFGMTEAACMIGWPKAPPKLEAMPSYEGIAAAGYVLPGSKIKLVDQCGDIVERNKPGTLHLSGDAISKGYLGGIGASSIYEEDGRSWYATSDCALMADDGLIYVLGRCDGMIERCGMTIAPATIENFLETEFPQSKVSMHILTQRTTS